MKAKWLLLIFALCSAGLWAQENRSAAVKPLEKEELLPVYREAPYPSAGRVRFNAPSFVWMPAIKARNGLNTFDFDNDVRYRVRISRDPQFKGESTILSPLQEWTFFNTHKALEPGTWYWSYAHVRNGRTQWYPTIEFQVKGTETDYVSPHFDQLYQAVGKDHPRVLATPQSLGKVALPKPVLAGIEKRVAAKLGKPLPALIYNNKAVMAEKRKTLNDEQYQLYITKRTRDNCKRFSADTSDFIMLYAATGERRYLDESLKRYRHFSKAYKNIVAIGQLLDFTEVAYHAVQAEIFDIAYDHLTADERQFIIASLTEDQRKNYHKFLHKPAHELHNSHYWQIEIRSFILNSLVLLHHTPEAKKWLDYAYNLFVVRTPTGSFDDGGWALGNGYFGVNQETLFVVPYLFTRLTGFNFFSKPWYQNVRAYVTYSAPVAHPKGGYGDNSYRYGESMLPLVRALNATLGPDSSGQLYETLFAQQGGKGPKEKSKMTWFASQPLDLQLGLQSPPADGAELPLAKQFRDVGLVAMHTRMDSPGDNFMLSMRSSPFGMIGHALAAQNAFNITYGGEPLFFHRGYYTNWADTHTLQSYRHTRAHNSILVDGMGQNFHTSGYGWVPRFLTGDTISYGLGDASRAYSGTIARDEIAARMEKFGIEATAENGFGDPGLKTFRRHLFMLRPNIAVIYDELEAQRPVSWTWLANSRRKMTVLEDAQVRVEGDSGVAQMTLLSSAGYRHSLSDQFHAPPVDWQGKGSPTVDLSESNYRYRAETGKTRKARFLAIIRVDGKGQVVPEVITGDGVVEVAGWTIAAQLNPERPAAFHIDNGRGSCIAMGHKQLECGGKLFDNHQAEATVLIERQGDRFKVQRAVDQWPDAAIYN